MTLIFQRRGIANVQVPVVIAAFFDFYISTSGSDANSGTLSSPWAITAINTKQATYAGKRVGIVVGTYDVSSLMGTNEGVPALNVAGGTVNSQTVIGSSDANGFYSPRVAVLDAKGASGFYGGSNANISPVLGNNGSGVNVGYFTLQGLKVVNFSYWAIYIGLAPGGTPVEPNVILQDLELTGGNGDFATGTDGVNLAPIVNVGTTNLLIDNCYIHDNQGSSTVNGRAHFSAYYQWGEFAPGGVPTSGTTIQYCTIVNSGGLHGKEANQQGTTIQYCYIDWSAGPNGQNGSCIQGFDGASTSQGATALLGLNQATNIHHNILVQGIQGMDLEAELNEGGWTTACNVYNNSFVNGRASAPQEFFRWFENASGSRLLTFYNNGFYDNGFHPPGSYGYMLVNSDAPTLLDYNAYGGGSSWNTVSPGAINSGTGLTNYTTLAAWKAAISADSNSISTASNPFTNNGSRALQYQIGSSSPWYQAGRVGGSGSTACNLGAWDGTVTRIGSAINGVLD